MFDAIVNNPDQVEAALFRAIGAHYIRQPSMPDFTQVQMGVQFTHEAQVMEVTATFPDGFRACVAVIRDPEEAGHVLQ